MSRFLLVVCLYLSLPAYAQDWPLKKLVTEAVNKGAPFPRFSPFRFLSEGNLPSGKYQVFTLSPDFINRIQKDKPAHIELAVPYDKNRTLRCRLVRHSLGNIKVTENNQLHIQGLDEPLTFYGVMDDQPGKNIVVLTVNKRYISLVLTSDNRVLQFTRANEANNHVYRLYNSDRIRFPAEQPDCGTTDKKKAGPDTSPEPTQSNPAAIENKCIYVFVDCSDSMYLWRDTSRQSTIDYVYELFNFVRAGYLNEQVNIQISAINVWTTPDPFRGDSRENALRDMADYWKDEFWGNICVGLDFGQNARSGLADDIGRVKSLLPGVCPAYGTDVSAICYNDLNYGGNYTNFPTGPNTTQSQVYLVMHEMGHLFGSYHTKWCGWKLTSNPDTFGALDSCGTSTNTGWAFTEGGCMQGPPPPTNGATIMSYCIGAPLFVNFNNGFGQQPGDRIRNYLGNNACVPDCNDCLGLRLQPAATQDHSWLYSGERKPNVLNREIDHHKTTNP